MIHGPYAQRLEELRKGSQRELNGKISLLNRSFEAELSRSYLIGELQGTRLAEEIFAQAWDRSGGEDLEAVEKDYAIYAGFANAAYAHRRPLA